MGGTSQSNPAPVAATGMQSASVTNPANPTGQVDTPAQPATPDSPTHDWEKRYKDLQSFHSKTVNTKDAEIATLQQSTAPKFHVPKTAEELQRFAGENPETYAFIQTIAHGIAENQMQTVNDRLSTAENQLAKSNQELAFEELQRAHPDFQKIDGSPEFTQWLAKQTQEVQGWIYNNTDDAQKISYALSLFKQQTGWGIQQETPASPTGPSDAELASQAVNVNGSVNTSTDQRDHVQYIWSESEIAKMRPEVYAQYQEAIDLASSEGRIAYGR
jgi:hypothetical protein